VFHVETFFMMPMRHAGIMPAGTNADAESGVWDRRCRRKDFWRTSPMKAYSSSCSLLSPSSMGTADVPLRNAAAQT